MNSFFWTCGHLGWTTFALAVFTGLWWLLTDLYWRLKSIRFRWLLVTMAAGWIVGVGLILLEFYGFNG